MPHLVQHHGGQKGKAPILPGRPIVQGGASVHTILSARCHAGSSMWMGDVTKCLCPSVCHVLAQAGAPFGHVTSGPDTKMTCSPSTFSAQLPAHNLVYGHVCPALRFHPDMPVDMDPGTTTLAWSFGGLLSLGGGSGIVDRA